ncbi:MAG: phosphoenolpyruvate--protein phosphotransferase [Deltaproteobacteria bacterium]|nr:phosphoenolpyruvate--protein phosphotransferase [Deltaproteobacteria bacterium]
MVVQHRVFQGVGASPGIGIGRVHLVDRRRVHYAKTRIQQRQIPAEIERFLAAIQVSERQLEALAQRLQQSIERTAAEAERTRPARRRTDPEGRASIRTDHLSILVAHRLMLRDPMLVDGTIARISNERLCAEWALRMTLREVKSLLDDVADDYFRERRSDVDFVGDRILRNLTGGGAEASAPEGSVVVAHDLSPADTLGLLRSKIAGFVTDVGGKTSHTAILAQALGLPAVVAAGDISDLAGDGDLVSLDGATGEVVLRPGRAVLARFRQVADKRAQFDAELRAELHLPTETRCGQRVALQANIDRGDEVELLLALGCDGVGLLRTEYLFLEEQKTASTAHSAAYRQVVEALAGLPVTIRTFDLGGDKVAVGSGWQREPNPALGLRAVRYCLRERDLFRAQLRGVLEASAHGKTRLLLPMISGVHELREVKVLLEEERAALRAAGIPFDERMAVGAMIELPAAVWIADQLATEVDFFSVGSNDLVQYILAADRDSELVAHLYRPLHPAVLRALQQTARAAQGAGIGLALCGNMASEPLYLPLLLGLGYSELSMPVLAIPRIKRVVRSVSMDECRALAAEALRLSTAPDVERLVDQRMRSLLEPALL